MTIKPIFFILVSYWQDILYWSNKWKETKNIPNKILKYCDNLCSSWNNVILNLNPPTWSTNLKSICSFLPNSSYYHWACKTLNSYRNHYFSNSARTQPVPKYQLHTKIATIPSNNPSFPQCTHFDPNRPTFFLLLLLFALDARFA